MDILASINAAQNRAAERKDAMASSAYGCPRAHTLTAIVGYYVRRTFPGTERAHEDVREFVGGHTYADAMSLAREIRRKPGCYAVVDNAYDCGCRGQG
jgi:hypothetical protein